MLSGGFDSAVAAWQMLRRGVRLDYLFCNLGGRAHELGALRVAKVLADRWSYGDFPHLHAIDFAGVAAEIRAKTKPRYWQIILKRQMLRAAEVVARSAAPMRSSPATRSARCRRRRSRTWRRSRTRVAVPILRPLVGANKDEIIRLAESDRHRAALRRGRRVLLDGGDAAGHLVARQHRRRPRKPSSTRSRARRALADRSVFDLRSLDVESRGIPELEIRAIPADAIVLDLRSRDAFAAWHWPGALHLDFERAVAASRSMARDRRYVLYCEFGLKSAHLAESMRRDGYDASNFRGGLAALVALAKSASA